MNSVFAHQFNTNYVPSDGEIESIREDLVSRAQELERLDERIRELSVQRDKIQAYVDSHKALISHPRRLPVDILREIFVACLPTSRNAVMSAQEAPLLLCRICSAWRTIARSTPRLWASLHVPFSFVFSKEPLRLPAVAQWLELSGACPISLSVHDCGEGWNLNPWTTSSERALTQSLAAVSARLRHVEFIDLSTHTARELAEMRTPQLESFTFTGQVSFLTTLSLVTSPCLRTVTLYPMLGSEPGSVQIHESILGIPLAWEQLTHLTIHRRQLPFRTIIALLERCTQLISLLFSPDDTDEEADWGSGQISLPHLRTFAVDTGYLPPNALGRLIGRLSMPQLRQFHVPTTGSSQGPDLVPLGMKSPLIEDLSLYLSTLETGSLPETLRAFPSLTKLLVVGSAWAVPEHEMVIVPTPAQVLDLLVSTLEIPFCSALQELSIQTFAPLEKSMLDTFIQGRMKLPGFRRLKIWSTDSWVTELIPETEIQSYASRGLDISLLWEDPWKNWPGSIGATPWMGLQQESE
ncbi:hypothetical protein B0H19DRAFT_1096291 [Mycena capillaripes]|nr:hypothetical protein B0H19DRAFT_1096291 [Mycena capillaripes]